MDLKMRTVPSRRRGVPVLLSIVLVATGLANGSSGSAATTQTSQREVQQATLYDGETVFRGLFFGSGPVAKLFPEIWDTPQASRQPNRSKEAGASLEDRIVVGIRKLDRTFFDRFGTDLQSRNHLTVEQALDEAGGLFRQRLNAESGSDVDLLEAMLDDEVDREPSEPSHYVHVYSYLVAVVAAVILILIILPPDPFRFQHQSLQREMFIDLMANRLGPATAD